MVAVLLSTIYSAGLLPQFAVAATECVVPERISLTAEPTPATPIGDEATPIDEDDATPIASPVGSAVATPRQLLAAGLENLVKTFAACRSDGNFETMTRLVTEKYLGAVYGGGPRLSRSDIPDDVRRFACHPGPLPRLRRSRRDRTRQARANVKLIVGKQLTFERMTFIEEKRRPGSLADRHHQPAPRSTSPQSRGHSGDDDRQPV